jgi:hypothetical protein
VADVESTLEALLRKDVEPSPLGRRLGLILTQKIVDTLPCCRRTLDREIERGRISVVRIAGTTYIRMDAVLAWWKQSQSRRRCRTIHHAADRTSQAQPQAHEHNRVRRRSSRTLPVRKAVL